MTPRSLVGMTMGARKRDARHAPVERFCTNCKIPLRLYDEVEPTPAESAGFIDPDSYACPKCRSETDNLRSDDKRAETRSFYRIGQRLRPCPGCQECGVRRFTKPEGFFSDNTHYVEIRDNAKVRLWRLKHKPILWCSKCGPRSVPTKFYDLEYCVGMVERFEWIELTQPNLCDGSGVLPARAKKVRR